MKYFHVSALLISLAFYTPSFSQSELGGGRIKGFVFNPEDEPAEYSTVVLMDHDSVFMDGTLTGPEGMFLFEDLKEGNYFIMIRNVEFNTFISDPIVMDGTSVVEFDHIQLQTRINDLAEVEVKAQKPLYVQKIDRLEVNVESSATMAGDNALEVLEKSPGVLVDRQNNSISLRGKDGVTVMINGKLTHMPMSAVFGMLEGMSASNIEKMELITTPPANLDAEGEGGFINIVLKQNENEGMSGMISLTGAYGRRGRGLAGGNFSFRKNKFNLYGDYNFNYTHGIGYAYSDRTISEPSNTFQSSTVAYRDFETKLHNARLGMDYYITPKTVIGVLGTYYKRVWTMDSDLDIQFESTPGPDSSGIGIIEELNKSSQYLINFNIQHTFNERNRINADLDYFNRISLQPTSYSNTYLDEDGQFLSREDLTTGKDTPLDIWVGSVDYTYNQEERFTLETGLKWSYSFFTNDVIYESLVNDEWVSDPEFAESATMNESVQAAYLSINYIIDEKTSLKTGLRYERTLTDLKLVSDESEINREFNHFFPTFFLSRQFNENNSLSLAYNRRISRPGFFDLAPFVFFIDPLTYITGNVNLLPAISSSFKSDYTFRKLLVSLQYTRINNSIQRFQPSRVPDSEYGVLSSVNLDLEERYSLSVSLPVNITKWWRMQNNVNGYYNQIDSDYPGGHLEIDQANFDFNTTLMFMLPLDFSIDLSFFYYSRAQNGIWSISAREILNVGVQKTFRNNWGTLSLNASNILNEPFMDGMVDLPEQQMEQHILLDFDTRILKLTYTRQFGNNKLKSRNNRESGAEEIMNRVGS